MLFILLGAVAALFVVSNIARQRRALRADVNHTASARQRRERLRELRRTRDE